MEAKPSETSVGMENNTANPEFIQAKYCSKMKLK